MTTDPLPPPRRSRVDWRTAFGFALSVGLLWWTLRDVAFADIWGTVRRASVPLLVAGIATATAIFPLRARRWRPILEPVAGSIPFGPLWRATAIGMMMNNVFPARAGEFGRAFALTREVPRVSIATSFGSLAVDRIFDAVVLLLLMFAAMLDPRFPPGVTFGGRTIPQLASSGIVLMALVVLCFYVAVLRPAWIRLATSAVTRRVVPKHEGTILRFVESGVGGLAVLTDTRRFAAVLGWAVAHWMTHALGLYLCFLAIGVDVPFTAALFLQGLLGIAVALPSSPGFVGIFEGASVLGLGVYGVPKELALSWAITYHILSLIPITVMGAYYLGKLDLNVGTLLRGRSAAA